ncbi:MAG: TonB-dependent receptor plug domain-containing protein, partial [Gemmatimonadaceae bacterium]
MQCSRRAFLTVGVLAVLGLGCARRGGPRPSDASQGTDAAPNVSTVTAKDLERTPGEIDKALAGRISGVTVTRTPDGGIAVRIRGAASAYGEPLYVIDG